MNDGPDTTERVERVDHGYRVTVESTRGTGTRDQDKVKLEARSETEPDSHDLERYSAKVEQVINRLRKNQPDEDDDGE
jgi:hypothetical protein